MEVEEKHRMNSDYQNSHFIRILEALSCSLSQKRYNLLSTNQIHQLSSFKYLFLDKIIFTIFRACKVVHLIKWLIMHCFVPSSTSYYNREEKYETRECFLNMTFTTQYFNVLICLPVLGGSICPRY